MLTERMERLKKFGESLPYVRVYFREDWEVIYFDLSSKMFGLMSPEVSPEATLTIKGNPDKNEELRELYQDILPGYHTNKKHWNTIYLRTEELSDEELEQMLLLSYELVWQGLPAKQKKELENT